MKETMEVKIKKEIDSLRDHLKEKDLSEQQRREVINKIVLLNIKLMRCKK